MRFLVWATIVGTGLSLCVGCSSSDNADPNKGPLPQRLQAARAMTDLGKRDAALSKIAQDAADAGDLDHMHQAINGMGVMDLRDAAIRLCALKLEGQGKHKDALAVANKMQNLQRREDLFVDLDKDKPKDEKPK